MDEGREAYIYDLGSADLMKVREGVSGEWKCIWAKQTVYSRSVCSRALSRQGKWVGEENLTCMVHIQRYDEGGQEGGLIIEVPQRIAGCLGQLGLPHRTQCADKMGEGRLIIKCLTNLIITVLTPIFFICYLHILLDSIC